MNELGDFQPTATLKGLPPSRTVVRVMSAGPDMNGFTIQCHLLSCYHLIPVNDLPRNGKRAPNGDPSKVQKRRCMACLELEQARPPIKTLVVVKRAG